mgnify:CR=1 FL=1
MPGTPDLLTPGGERLCQALRMELSNEFDVAAPIDQAWRVLTDLERIAPCLPGAQLQEVEGDEYRGIIKVKVGPVTAQYKGKATVVERDEAAGRAVLSADGRDTRGQGNASATITAQLTPSDAGTHVVVDTDLKVTGKVAQFGRGVMADVDRGLGDDSFSHVRMNPSVQIRRWLRHRRHAAS